MDVHLSLGSYSLVLKPETSFEEDVLQKFFQDKEVTGRTTKDGKMFSLYLNFSGGAAPSKKEERNPD